MIILLLIQYKTPQGNITIKIINVFKEKLNPAGVLHRRYL